MRYTKSGKEILEWRADIIKEAQEVRAAQKAVSIQVSQLNRKLYYLPLIWFILKITIISALLFCIVRFSGYVTGQAEEKPQQAYSCPIAHCPVVKECLTTELPKTGAN